MHNHEPGGETRLDVCERRAARLAADWEILAHDQVISPGGQDGGGVSSCNDAWRRGRDVNELWTRDFLESIECDVSEGVRICDGSNGGSVD